jgi:predicted RNA binding protein YcfA (HicA-like mRNA interferase family)
VILPRNIWDQLRNKSVDDLVSALERDGWIRDEKKGAEQVYRHPDGRRVSIHYHPGKTCGPSLLKALLADIGWSVQDMRRLKLIK